MCALFISIVVVFSSITCSDLDNELGLSLHYVIVLIIFLWQLRLFVKNIHDVLSHMHGFTFALDGTVYTH